MSLTARAKHSRALVSLGVAAVLLIACTGSFADDPIEDVGKTVNEWVKTRAETVRLEEKWKEEKELLASTVDAMKDHANQLQDKRDHLAAATKDEREEIAALNAKREKADQSLHAAEARLDQLTAGVIALRPRLPPRLSDALEMAYRSLGGTDLSPAERMKLVMTVLNRCAQFNSTIEQGEEIIRFDGEATPLSVDVIYWGLSHGYALDRVSGRAWLGTPGTDKWRWEPLEGAGPAIAELIAVRRDEANPDLVTVPALLSGAKGGGN